MRLCQSVGCYSHPNQTPNHYSLKKYDSVYGGIWAFSDGCEN